MIKQSVFKQNNTSQEFFATKKTVQPKSHRLSRRSIFCIMCLATLLYRKQRMDIYVDILRMLFQIARKSI